MKPTDLEALRPLAEFLIEGRGWAAENDLEGALDDNTHRDVVTAALNGWIPAERRNNRWHYRSSRVPEMVRRLAARTARPQRPAPSLSSAA